MADIYFKNEYGRLYENAPDKKFEIFEYEDDLGKITHRFIKRKIPISLPEDAEYYDIATPYGYGGPLIEAIENEQQKLQLLQKFETAFSQYAEQENIVAEFVRFHPLVYNSKDFDEIYDVSWNRQTVATDLTYKDPFMTEFSKSTRKRIRKILKDKHISYEVIEEPDNLDEFIDLYYATMDRNQADSGYYFDKSYFNQMLATLRPHLLVIRVYYDDVIICKGLYFKYDQYLHAHLSGTHEEYTHFSPTYILEYAAMEYGKKQGYKLVHYGGGKTADQDDSLLRYKVNFGKNTKLDFYIGCKVWNEVIYKKLCQATDNENVKDYFPAYRK